MKTKLPGSIFSRSLLLTATGSGRASTVEQRLSDREQVEKMIDGLEEKEAQVVRLFHLDGKSYREISLELGIPVNTIGSALSRARAKMRSAAHSPAE